MVHIPNKYVGQTDKVCMLFNNLDNLIPKEISQEIDSVNCVFKFEYTKDDTHPTLIGTLTVYKDESERLTCIDAAADLLYDDILWFEKINTEEQKYFMFASYIDTDKHEVDIDIYEPLVTIELHDYKNKNLYM